MNRNFQVVAVCSSNRFDDHFLTRPRTARQARMLAGFLSAQDAFDYVAVVRMVSAAAPLA